MDQADQFVRQQAEAKGWADERLKVMVLQAVAHHAHGEKDEAVRLLGDALALAEPGGFIRIFVDEGSLWPVYYMRPFLAALHQIMFAGCWQHSPMQNLSKLTHR